MVSPSFPPEKGLNMAKPQYRVKYTQNGLPGFNYTTPVSYPSAMDLLDEFKVRDGITSAVVVGEDGKEPTLYQLQYTDSRSPAPTGLLYTDPEPFEEMQARRVAMSKVEGIEVVARMTPDQVSGYGRETGDRVGFVGDHDVDEEVSDGITSPVAEPEQAYRVRYSLAGKPGFQFTTKMTQAKAEREADKMGIQEIVLSADVVEDGEPKAESRPATREDRLQALEFAMKLGTMPLGGMRVQTSGPSAAAVVENAEIFLKFLRGDNA